MVTCKSMFLVLRSLNVISTISLMHCLMLVLSFDGLNLFSEIRYTYWKSLILYCIFLISIEQSSLIGYPALDRCWSSFESLYSVREEWSSICFINASVILDISLLVSIIFSFMTIEVTSLMTKSLSVPPAIFMFT